MNLQNVPVVMQLVSFWRECKSKKVDSLILSTLTARGFMSADALSGWVGHSTDEVQKRLESLRERGLVSFSNGKWNPTSPVKVDRLGR